MDSAPELDLPDLGLDVDLPTPTNNATSGSTATTEQADSKTTYWRRTPSRKHTPNSTLEESVLAAARLISSKNNNNSTHEQQDPVSISKGQSSTRRKGRKGNTPTRTPPNELKEVSGGSPRTGQSATPGRRKKVRVHSMGKRNRTAPGGARSPVDFASMYSAKNSDRSPESPPSLEPQSSTGNSSSNRPLRRMGGSSGSLFDSHTGSRSPVLSRSLSGRFMVSAPGPARRSISRVSLHERHTSKTHQRAQSHDFSEVTSKLALDLDDNESVSRRLPPHSNSMTAGSSTSSTPDHVQRSAEDEKMIDDGDVHCQRLGSSHLLELDEDAGVQTMTDMWSNDPVRPSYHPNGGRELGKWRLKWFEEFQGGRLRHQAAQLLEQSHELRRQMEHGVKLFNQKPSKGLKFLIEKDLIDGDPEGIAQFLLVAQGLNKSKVGEYLGDGDAFNISVMFAYVNRLNFSGKDITSALRYYLSGFRLPGEGQMIDRLMEKFAERYCRDNPDVFPNQDLAHLLAYALIMLNTDLHSVRIKNKMTKKEFTRNCRDLVKAGMSKKFLHQCFDSIAKNEITVPYNYLERLYARIQAQKVSRVQYYARVKAARGAGNTPEVLRRRSLDFKNNDDDDAMFNFHNIGHFAKLSAGGVFLKHGRQGNPHRRKVWLSDDGTQIFWQDTNQKKKPRSIPASEVEDVFVGRDTSTVFRRAADIPDIKDPLCFSIKTPDRTLDLEADSPEDVRLWVEYLTSVVEENTLRRESAQQQKQRERKETTVIKTLRKWKEFMLKNWDLYQTIGKGKAAERFRRIWMRGIPPSVRRVAWPRAIGNSLQVTVELFKAFLEQARAFDKNPEQGFVRHQESLKQLDIDLPRTFPELQFFHTAGPLMLKDPLRDLLLTYMFFRPDIGYMKGMSHIAAMLLLYVDFYEAFVCFANLLHSHYFLSCLRMDMQQLKWRFDFFSHTFAEALPTLFHHFSELNITLDMFYLPWCQSLFCKALDLDLASRIWDAYLLVGETIIVKAGIAILQTYEKQLLLSDLEDCLLLLNTPTQHVDEEEFWSKLEAAPVDEVHFNMVLNRYTHDKERIRQFNHWTRK